MVKDVALSEEFGAPEEGQVRTEGVGGGWLQGRSEQRETQISLPGRRELEW